MSEHENNQPLMDLYPFLHKKEKDPRQEKITLLNSIKEKSAQSITIKKIFFERNSENLLEMAHALVEIYKGKGRMLAMGNGGSSCDAAHFCVEFQHPVTAGRPALPAINLLSDMAVTSAIANDIGFEHVYVRQLCAHGQQGDGLIGFSTSGNSKNVIKAIEAGHEREMKIIALTGKDGGEIARLLKNSDIEIRVPADSTARIQEVHILVLHCLCDLIDIQLFGDN